VPERIEAAVVIGRLNRGDDLDRRDEYRRGGLVLNVLQRSGIADGHCQERDDRGCREKAVAHGATVGASSARVEA
jgi:hypothetical protein